MAKVAISLPDDLLQRIEEARQGTGETRSEFLRRSVEQTLRAEQDREWDRQYVEAYRRTPMSQDEQDLIKAALSVSPVDPWEDAPETR